MKIFSAKLAIERPFTPIEEGAACTPPLMVPAGAEVSAIGYSSAGVDQFHLNYRDPDGRTWDAVVLPSDLVLGPVVATVNEG